MSDKPLPLFSYFSAAQGDKCPTLTELERLYAVWLYQHLRTVSQVAKMMGVSRSTASAVLGRRNLPQASKKRGQPSRIERPAKKIPYQVSTLN